MFLHASGQCASNSVTNVFTEVPTGAYRRAHAILRHIAITRSESPGPAATRQRGCGSEGTDSASVPSLDLEAIIRAPLLCLKPMKGAQLLCYCSVTVSMAPTKLPRSCSYFTPTTSAVSGSQSGVRSESGHSDRIRSSCTSSVCSSL